MNRSLFDWPGFVELSIALRLKAVSGNLLATSSGLHQAKRIQFAALNWIGFDPELNLMLRAEISAL